MSAVEDLQRIRQQAPRPRMAENIKEDYLLVRLLEQLKDTMDPALSVEAKQKKLRQINNTGKWYNRIYGLNSGDFK